MTGVLTPLQGLNEMVTIILEPGGLYYDLENKIIAAIKPRPAFLPVLRMLNGVMEFDETRGLLVTEHWCERNRRASDGPQDTQRDRQTQEASSSSARLAIFLSCLLIQERMVQVAMTVENWNVRLELGSQGGLEADMD